MFCKVLGIKLGFAHRGYSKINSRRLVGKMVVMEPVICDNTDNFRLCSQALKDLYNLKHEILFSLKKKNEIQSMIDNLVSWSNAPPNSSKWRNITNVINLAQKLKKDEEDLTKNIVLSEGIEFKDAMFMLKNSEVYNQVLKNIDPKYINKISPATIASLISTDAPINVLKDLKESIKDNRLEPSDFKTPRKFVEKSQEGILSKIFSYLPKSFSDTVTSTVPSTGGPSISMIRATNSKFGVTLTEEEKIANSIMKRLRSKRTKSIDKNVLISEYSDKLNRLSGLRPKKKEDKLENAKKVFDTIIKNKLPETTESDGNLIVTGQLPEDLELRTKLISKDPKSVEKEFVKTVINKFKEKSQYIKNDNKEYNDELDKLQAMYTSVKKSSEYALSQMKRQIDTFKYIRDRNIDQISQTAVKELPLWRRLFHPTTVVKLINYSNDLVDYLTLINEIITVDPTVQDPNMLAMFFKDLSIFDDKNYYTRTIEKIRYYIKQLEEYRDSWERYRATAESIISNLASSNEQKVREGLYRINLELEQGNNKRPSIVMGIKDVETEYQKKKAEVLPFLEQCEQSIKLLNEENKELVKNPLANSSKISKNNNTISQIRSLENKAKMDYLGIFTIDYTKDQYLPQIPLQKESKAIQNLGTSYGSSRRSYKKRSLQLKNAGSKKKTRRHRRSRKQKTKG
jgi:hypothetical protein